jgi:hypothetical protein
MSSRQRGQEITLRVAVDGQLQTGSFFKVKSFHSSPRTDIVEDDYMGEAQTDLDIQHHGWDLTFDLDELDAKVIDFLTTITTLEEEHKQHPKITITATYVYRTPGVKPKIEVYSEVILKVNQRGSGGRKERVMSSFEGKCKKRQVVNAPP